MCSYGRDDKAMKNPVRDQLLLYPFYIITQGPEFTFKMLSFLPARGG